MHHFFDGLGPYSGEDFADDAGLFAIIFMFELCFFSLFTRPLSYEEGNLVFIDLIAITLMMTVAGRIIFGRSASINLMEDLENPEPAPHNASNP